MLNLVGYVYEFQSSCGFVEGRATKGEWKRGSEGKKKERSDFLTVLTGELVSKLDLLVWLYMFNV